MFQVQRIEAEKFSKIWNKGGVHILLTQEAIDFATDFANVAIQSFIEVCQKQAALEQELAKKPQLIVEGVR